MTCRPADTVFELPRGALNDKEANVAAMEVRNFGLRQ
jgi:hypothetical protein